jgi:DNA-binding MarR family transcriptional regulator
MTTTRARRDRQRLQAWRDFVLSYNRIMPVLEREMDARTGITLSQYDVLLRLAETVQGRMKMSDLADAIVYSTGGLTRLFERMCRAGLVRREPSGDDRRVIYAVLTDHGRQRLQAASAVHLDGVGRHFAICLPDEEVDVVASFLARLHTSAVACGI